MWRNIVSIAIALFVGYVFVKLLLIIFGVTLKAVFSLVVVILVLIFALPIFIIARKSLFKNGK